MNFLASRKFQLIIAAFFIFSGIIELVNGNRVLGFGDMIFACLTLLFIGNDERKNKK